MKINEKAAEQAIYEAKRKWPKLRPFVIRNGIIAYERAKLKLGQAKEMPMRNPQDQYGPDSIFLQTHSDYTEEATWHEGRIHDDDIKYLKATPAREAAAALFDALVRANRFIEEVLTCKTSEEYLAGQEICGQADAAIAKAKP